MSDRYSRQQSIVPQEVFENAQFAIIGVGAVGREVARTLACNGAKNLTIYDFDTVELHNCSTQGYKEADVGKLKVDATREEILSLNSEINITVVPDRWRPSKDKQFDVVFFCVDSLSMRGKLFNYFAESAKFIGDSRIGGEQIRVLSVTGNSSREHYPTTLSDDGTAYQHGCHVPMVKHSANIAASLLVQQFINVLNGMPVYADRLYSLPTSEVVILKEAID